ncbi:MAG: hypothetical protein NTV09_10565 [Bacteroidetes bacterium]|nr:hypothetical protein [Bacteroidota bacterium]
MDYLYGMHLRKLIILLALPLFVVAQPTNQWRKAIKNGVQSINSAAAINVDKTGNVFIAGTTHDADSADKLLLIKLDSAGNEKWRRAYQAENRNHAVAIAMTVDFAGNSLVTGTVKNRSGNTDIVTLKYSPEGILLWENFFAGKANLFDAPNAIATDKKGNVLVCGHETVSEANPDLLIIRYTPTGETSFIRNFSTPQMDVAVDVLADDSCNVYVCGNINVGTRIADIIVMKFDSTGTPQWNYVYDGEQHVVDIATDFAFDDSTNIFITGSANHSNDKSDIPVIKINRNGKLMSENLISGGVADGTGNRISSSGKNIFLQTSFTDYLQQTVSVSIFKGDKSCKQKKLYNSSGDISYLKAAGWNNNAVILFGSILSRPENTIAPYVEIVDSLNKTTFSMHDDVLISLLRIKDVLLAGRDIYFLGDDATENAGTISIAKYSFPEPPKKKSKVSKPNTQ